jgi:hypothetical protein
MKVLLVTPEPVDAGAVRSAVGEGADDAEIMVVVPATDSSPMRFWMSDVDSAIADAETTQEEVVDSLSAEGISADGNVGEPEPALAIQDALATFPADRIVIFSRPDGDQDYREDAGLQDAEQRFGVPVTHLTLP